MKKSAKRLTENHRIDASKRFYYLYSKKRLCDYMCCATVALLRHYCYYFYYYCSPRLRPRESLVVVIHNQNVLLLPEMILEKGPSLTSQERYGQSHERGRFLFATTVLFSFVVVVVVIVFTIVSSMKRLSNGETVSGFSWRS